VTSLQNGKYKLSVYKVRCDSLKTWQYIRDHNSGKTRLTFIIFALL